LYICDGDSGVLDSEITIIANRTTLPIVLTDFKQSEKGFG